jgi:molybdenum cofactor cytidylyltransferase
MSLLSHNAPVVLVLASGRGERFLASGGTVHKLQALLGDKPVLEHTLDAARASGLPWHLEDAGHPGMGDSIAAAVRATHNPVGWLILPGDLPLVTPGSIRAVAQALTAEGGQHDVVVPTHHGQRGHPVGFSGRCGAELQQLRGERGAASVVRMHDVLEVPVDDVGVVTDVDTVEQLQAAYALLRARGR